MDKDKPLRFAIIGAGTAGTLVLKEVERSGKGHVVAFFDDDPEKASASINGVPVAGPILSLPERAGKLGVDQVIIAIPSSTHEEMKRIVGICESTGIEFRILPAVLDVLSGTFLVPRIRDVRIEDLLHRKPVVFDKDAVLHHITGRRVLVTGCGSIGSEICRQVATLDPAKLTIAENSEISIYNMDKELRETSPDLNFKIILCDIRDSRKMEEVFASERPDIVFHTAAYKHVPIVEDNVAEAIKTNVFGTINLCECSEKFGVSEFVFISTDKAVNPKSMMGATKWLAEQYISSRKGSKTKFISVRFGNVLGSSGSVVPLFEKQIKEGGPVTVTHPEMTRYFMTIPEAAQLVIQVISLSENGDVFILDMGLPYKILDLARDMIRLSGMEPGKDIDIVFTGIRPGEKLAEELSISSENLENTANERILRLKRSQQSPDVESVISNLREWVYSKRNEELSEVLRGVHSI